MNKKILIPTILFILMIGLVSAEVIYQEDFEDGIADNWTLPYFMTINDTNPISGSYDLLLGDYESGYPDVGTYVFTDEQKEMMTNNVFELKYNVKIDNDIDQSTMLIFQNTDGISTIGCGIKVYGRLYCYNTYGLGEQYLTNTTNGTIYEIKYLFDDEQRTFEIFLDNVSVLNSTYGETNTYSPYGLAITHLTDNNPQEHIDDITITLIRRHEEAIRYRESSDLTGAVIDNGTKLIVGFGSIALLFGLLVGGAVIVFAYNKLIKNK